MPRAALPILLLSAAWLATVATPQSTAARELQTPAGQASPSAKGDAVHGRYIVEHVAMCVECHSERNHAGVIRTELRFMGGQIPTRPVWATEWADRAPRNAGLPGYSDEAAMRLLTRGAIGRDGGQLRPPMPRFRMTPRDAADVIAFMRSLG